MRKTFPNKVFSTPPASSAGPRRALSSSFCLQITSRPRLPQQRFVFFPLLLFRGDTAQRGAHPPDLPQSTALGSAAAAHPLHSSDAKTQKSSGWRAVSAGPRPSVPKHPEQDPQSTPTPQQRTRHGVWGLNCTWSPRGVPPRHQFLQNLVNTAQHGEIFTLRTV